MNQSSPLCGFGWLEVAQKMRNTATDTALDKLASQMDISHTPGTRVKNRGAYAPRLSETVDVVLPAINCGGKSIGETIVQMVPTIIAHTAVTIECSAASMAYVQLAMHASANSTASRARPKHNDRFSVKTGVRGVTFVKARQLMQKQVVNADGKMTRNYQAIVEAICEADQAASFKRRAFSAVEPDCEVDAVHPHDDAAQCNEHNAEDTYNEDDSAAEASSLQAASSAYPTVPPDSAAARASAPLIPKFLQRQSSSALQVHGQVCSARKANSKCVV